MHFIELTIIFAFIAMTLFFLFQASGQKSKVLVERWAKGQNLRLISCSARLLARGPFSAASQETRHVYRISAELPNGRLQWGWIRCRNEFNATATPPVECRWDQESASRQVNRP